MAASALFPDVAETASARGTAAAPEVAVGAEVESAGGMTGGKGRKDSRAWRLGSGSERSWGEAISECHSIALGGFFNLLLFFFPHFVLLPFPFPPRFYLSVFPVQQTSEAMRELRAEVLIPLLLQAAQRKKQAQAARGEGDEAKQAGKQEAEAARSKGWDVTARGERTGEAASKEEGERRNDRVGGHAEKQGENYGRGVSAARCLKFVRITDVTEADHSTANHNRDNDRDNCEAGNEHGIGFVRMVDVFEDESAVHMVMEHCEGGDLFEHVAQHERLDERQTAAIMRQLATAVTKMHEMGVVHRDLKPENILLTTSLTVKIADYGLARVLKRGCRLHGLVGSPFYMAPETVRGREYGPEVDVWSLGVIMYTCLSGTLPFFGKNQNAVFAAVCRGEVDLETGSHWPLISHEAKDLIRRMLDVDPNQRIGSSRIVHHPWFKRAGGEHCSLTEVKASQSQRRGRFVIFSAPSSPVPVARCLKNVDGAGGAARLSLSSKDESMDKAMEDGVLGCSPNSVLEGVGGHR
ncbi:unnamed protein product [Closterium sp. Yama58-4]|nr:unnamed protein product [Closterium sp. Yama58-4]